MQRDWNIVDDEVDRAPADREPAPFVDDHLDTERIARLVRRRRAEDRAKLWKVGAWTLAALSGIAVVLRLTGLW